MRAHVQNKMKDFVLSVNCEKDFLKLIFHLGWFLYSVTLMVIFLLFEFTEGIPQNGFPHGRLRDATRDVSWEKAIIL